MSQTGLDEPSSAKQDGLTGNTCPRLYQVELFEEAKRRNIIIRADTGTGKTLVAVLLIKWMATQPKPDNERHILQAFLVPTRPLVQQQANAIRMGTNLRVGEYTGDHQPELRDVEKWRKDLQQTDVIVCTAQVSLLVFDEAHHCRKNHIYNQIMQVHFRRLSQDPHHRRVPKILGMTASPIWDCKSLARAEKDIKSLQSDLCAQLYEIKETRDDINRYTNKPKESIVYYAPVTFVDNLLEPHWEYVQVLVDAHADSKFLVASRAIQEGLGQYAYLLFVSDWLSSLLLPSTIKNVQDPRILEPTYRLKIEEAIKKLELLVNPNDVPLSQTTPKFQALIRVLLEYKDTKGDNKSFHGMIFAERRTHAQLLHRMMSRCVALKEFIKSCALTGHATNGRSGGCDDGMASKAQNRAVENFRTGETNLAIATNVAEEGLDFRACRVVIRFDEINTWKGYIQSRGRARAANSDYIVLLPEGTNSKYLQFVGKEKELETNLYIRPNDEEICDAAVESTPQLINSLGGGKDAILTFNSAISVLNDVCQLLPYDEYADIPKLQFEEFERRDGFVCRLTLPSMAALPSADRTFESDSFPKKKAAKQSVCFKACQALRLAGVLDRHFMAQLHHHKSNPTDADGRPLPTLPLPEKVEVICPNLFGSVHASDVWLHKISFDLGQQKPSTFGFLCGQKLVVPPGPVIYDHTREGKPLPIIIESAVKMCWTEEERSCNLAWLETFTRMGMQAAINRREYEGDLLFFIAPLLEDTMEIDWELVKSPLSPITSVDEIPKYKEIIVPLRCLHHRIFTSHTVCPDLTSNSKPGEVPSDRNLLRFIKNFKSFKSLGHFYSILDMSLRDKLQSPLVYLESDFVAEDTLVKNVVAKPCVPFKVLLPSTACKGSHLPSYFWRIFSFLPALTRRIHDAIQVQAALNRLAVPNVSLDLAIEALTPPGLDVPWDYQTLETLGDAFLKLATSVHVYLSHVRKGEGDMTVLRAKSVDNQYLRSKSLQVGLESYVLSYRYRIDRFRAAHMDEGLVLPNGQFQRKIPRRVLSDIVEALLGAGYISGGIETALKIGTAVDLCFGGTVPWSQRPHTFLSHANNEDAAHQFTPSHLSLQDVIGYSFKQPLLLIQALTHRSSGSLLTNCYEREEWLGDAILDMWITEHCYRRFENPTAAQLTTTRACLVTNASLGYLALRKLGLRALILHNSRHFEDACEEALKEIASFTDVGSFYEDLTNPFVVFEPPKILGDALEAIVGAMFIDCGLDLQVVYKSLDKIYEDVLPHLKQAEPRDPLSRLLKLRDKHLCAELRRVTRLSVEKTGSDDVSYESMRICEITLHGEMIATGRHPTSPIVAEQRACLTAYEILTCEPNADGVDTQADPWLKCHCQASLTLAKSPSIAKKTEDTGLPPLYGKKNKKKRSKRNRLLRLEQQSAADCFSQPVEPVKAEKLLNEDRLKAEDEQDSNSSDPETCIRIIKSRVSVPLSPL
ncbi:hypothetical protein CROQUDRAFT_53300 [Cronartium quercuum f. sp. fusiforme G11]|uniref:Dicer-like protein 1 n=1 Tax=Cronartium quercuum f. sp. fusiforme G11 TaxID=708437 RepID=A0A9P6NAQ8_9BASI|nr:hypothetical protein CROQUDRAFT_53300 [Cronartium quercuum f. sp. fusiforme G11]